MDTTEDHTQDQFLFSNAIDAKSVEPWVEGPFLRFRVDDFSLEDTDKLYDLVHELYKKNLPTVLVAKQPPTYPLFFDVDIKGTLNTESMTDTMALLQLEQLTLFHNLAKAVQEIYDCDGATMAIYESHGISIPLSEGFTDSSYAKASFHIVFPDIIVDRPVNCVKCDGQPNSVAMRRHMRVMDHVRLYFNCSDDTNLRQLLDELRPLGNDSWSEILDENPLWHEPWDDLTGMRLCYTKKKGEKRARIKVPWKAFRIGKELVEFTRDVDVRQWSQWANLQDPRGILDVTPWHEGNLRKYAIDDGLCECRLCYGDKKYVAPTLPGWEAGWKKARDPEWPAGTRENYRFEYTWRHSFGYDHGHYWQFGTWALKSIMVYR